jgi:SAM-dependent methyltransferase
MSEIVVNEAQSEYWNATAGPVWVEFQERLDRQLAPLGDAAQAALAPQVGERILDVGCGCGQTTLSLAQAVAPCGEVVGVDISRPMLAIAHQRSAGVSEVKFHAADAQTAVLGEASFDAVYSRFGVMFFADPAAAFANLARAVASGGRLAFVCWRPLAENLWMRGPLEAGLTVLPPPAPADPAAPGPFAFADPQRVRAILEAAGWTQVSIAPHDTAIGVGGVDETLSLALRVGPLGAALRESPHLAAPAMAAVRDFLVRHDGPDGVRLPAAVWIVTARRA